MSVMSAAQGKLVATYSNKGEVHVQ